MALNFNFEKCTKVEINEFIGILGNLKNIVSDKKIIESKQIIDKYFSDKDKVLTILKLIKNTKNFFKLMKKNESFDRQPSTSKEDGDSSRFQIINSTITNFTVGNSTKENSSTNTDTEKERTSCEELKKKHEELIRTSKETETNLNIEISSLKSELQKENSSHEELKKKYDTLTKTAHEKEDNFRTVNLCLKTELDKLKMNFENLSLIHENVITESNERFENLQEEISQLQTENTTLNNALNDRNIRYADCESLPDGRGPPFEF